MAKKKATKKAAKRRSNVKMLRGTVTDATALDLLGENAAEESNTEEPAWVVQEGRVITFTRYDRVPQGLMDLDGALKLVDDPSTNTVALHFTTVKQAVTAYNGMWNDNLCGVDEAMPDNTRWKSDELKKFGRSL